MNKRMTLSLLLILASWALPAAAQARLDYATIWLAGDDLQVEASANAEADEIPSAPQRDLRVRVWHDRGEDEVYERGEALEVNFRANQDLFVVVYRVDADGYVEILWPTSRYDDGFVYGEHDYVLPQDGSARRLRVSTNKGIEYLEAIASRYPFDLRDLAIDFRFDREEQERYDYAVDGDPFMAVNDINYAITGLKEDVDYVVTDYSYYYVESEVQHARYACRQCHTDDYDHHPYEQTCTQVTIRYDAGWYDSWYVRYGWYPVYYDPYYTYWDYAWGRPYYYWNYPVYYTWPSYYYSTYCRSYPVYYYDNYYDNPGVKTRTNGSYLYDTDGKDRGIASTLRRDVFPAPDGDENASRSSIPGNREMQVRNREMPVLADRATRSVKSDGRRTGPDVSRRSSRASDVGERRISSLGRAESTQVKGKEEARTLKPRQSDLRENKSRESKVRETPRSWTKPVVRNRDGKATVKENPRVRQREEAPAADERPLRARPSLRPKATQKSDEKRSVDRPREIRRPDPPREKQRADTPKQEVRQRSESRPQSTPAPRETSKRGSERSNSAGSRDRGKSDSKGRG